MSTNLMLDDNLIEAAKTMGQHRSKREAVNAALSEYVQRLRQQAVITEFGSVDYG